MPTTDQHDYTRIQVLYPEVARVKLGLTDSFLVNLIQKFAPASTGVVGKDGKNGKDGLNGTNGTNGTNGVDGIDGTNLGIIDGGFATSTYGPGGIIDAGNA